MAALLSCTILGGCATETPDNRAQFMAPATLSELYSQANLRLSMAVTPAAPECAPPCAGHAQFDQRVSDIGARIAAAAYQAYPDLAERIPKFSFSVLDKAEPGTGSTAAGGIVVLRPVDELARSDQALSFVLAREVGHVVARHHEENTGASIMISVVTTVVAPVLNVAKLVAGLATSAGAWVSSAGMSVASFFGSRAVVDTYRPRQQEQADTIALGLLDRMGYGAGDVAPGFAAEPLRAAGSRWLQDLQASLARLNKSGKPETVSTSGQSHQLALAPAP
ncbi:MAG TPA: M48 family metalloprotease [Burkholderiales bacterium]|nr:M48 family metalloprotease [Burkholderiales bacterium]